jgi:hypothetical protein
MFLRKLWTAKLGEWLFGTGVAVACIVPIGASASTTGGFLMCAGSEMLQCLDNTTGLPCSNLSGDGSDPTMLDACGTLPGEGSGMYPSAAKWKCAVGCNNGALEGHDCSVNNAGCYY